MLEHFDDLDDCYISDGKAFQTSVLGWSFGDGHQYDERLLQSLQGRCHFGSGEATLIFTDTQPLFKTAAVPPHPGGGHR